MLHRRTLIKIKGYWIDHIKILGLPLNKLKEIGLARNIEGSIFEETKMKYLGVWVTYCGHKNH